MQCQPFTNVPLIEQAQYESLRCQKLQLISASVWPIFKHYLYLTKLYRYETNSNINDNYLMNN